MKIDPYSRPQLAHDHLQSSCGMVVPRLTDSRRNPRNAQPTQETV